MKIIVFSTDQSLQTLPSNYLFPEATQNPRASLLSRHGSNATQYAPSHVCALEHRCTTAITCCSVFFSY